jgi:hypothetical protein
MCGNMGVRHLDLTPDLRNIYPSQHKRGKGSYEEYGNNPLYPRYFNGEIEEKTVFGIEWF